MLDTHGAAGAEAARPALDQGLQTLAQCIDGYCIAQYDPEADGVAVEAIRLLFENLPKLALNADDTEARRHVERAASMGQTVSGKGQGAIHALSAAMSEGTASAQVAAVLIPFVLAAQKSGVEAKMARLAAYLGLAPNFEAFVHAVVALRLRLGLPHALRDLGFDESRRDAVADRALAGAGAQVFLTRERALDIYDRALAGRV